jgi:hypothetical protein
MNNECDKVCNTKSGINYYKAAKHRDFKYVIYNIMFRSITFLNRHFDIEHFGDSIDLLECDLCEKKV